MSQNVCCICLDDIVIESDMRVKIKIDEKITVLYEFCIGTPWPYSGLDNPSEICIKCVAKIDEYATFKRRCIKSEHIWKSQIYNLNNSEKTDSPEVAIVYEIKYEEDKTSVHSYTHGDNDLTISNWNEPGNQNEYDFENHCGVDKIEAVECPAENQKCKEKERRNSWKCPKCLRGFRKELFFKRHVKTCKVDTESKSSTKPDIISKTTTKDDKTLQQSQFFCGICKISKLDNETESQHFNNHLENNHLNCMLCRYTGRDFADMIHHRYDHYPAKASLKIYTCTACRKICQNREKLTFHYRSVHLGKDGGWCPVCNKKIRTYKSFRNHLRRHASDNFICDHCGVKFLFRNEIIEHMKLHLNVRDFICESCGKGFVKSSNLKSHIYNIHTVKKRVQCPHCSRTYVCERALKKHLDYVAKDKPFVCDVCAKAYPSEAELKTHAIWHSNERPFACDLCKNRYKKKQNLEEHRLSHGFHRPHVCTLCSKGFYTKRLLKRHQSVHTGVRHVKCLYCARTFHSRSVMLSHCSSKHKNEVEEENCN